MLNQAIIHGKEYRKSYRKSKSFDRSCRNHGGCPYCESGRLYNASKNSIKSKFILQDDLKEIDIDISDVIVNL